MATLASQPAPAAARAKPLEPMPTTTNLPDPTKSGLGVELRAELRGINPLSFRGEGLWIGLNNKNVSHAGDRLSPAEPLLTMLDAKQWRESIDTFTKMKFLPPRALRVEDGYTKELADLSGMDTVVVRYWGLEHADHEEGKPLDPRAQLLSSALTGTTWEWPCQYVYAQIQAARPAEDAKSTSKAQAQTLKASKAPTYGLTRGFLNEPPKPPPRNEAQAIVRADRGAETEAISAGEAAPAPAPAPAPASAPPPPPSEPDVPVSPGSGEPGKRFFPSAEYVYPDGTVRTTPAGFYTEDEFLARAFEEQARYAEAMAPLAAVQGATYANDPQLSREASPKSDAPTPPPRPQTPAPPFDGEAFALPASVVDGLANVTLEHDDGETDPSLHALN